MLLVAAVALGKDPGCGGVDSTTGGVNAPCTRDKDCTAGLTCLNGSCVAPDSGLPPPDAASDAGSEDAGDGG
jgi:Dickkopf-like protein